MSERAQRVVEREHVLHHELVKCRWAEHTYARECAGLLESQSRVDPPRRPRLLADLDEEIAEMGCARGARERDQVFLCFCLLDDDSDAVETKVVLNGCDGDRRTEIA